MAGEPQKKSYDVHQESILTVRPECRRTTSPKSPGNDQRSQFSVSSRSTGTAPAQEPDLAEAAPRSNASSEGRHAPATAKGDNIPALTPALRPGHRQPLLAHQARLTYRAAGGRGSIILEMEHNYARPCRTFPAPSFKSDSTNRSGLTETRLLLSSRHGPANHVPVR